MKKKDALKHFDPNAPSGNPKDLFGLPFTAETANIIVIPAPWDVTTSYSAGTSKGPKAILKASQQVDLYDAKIKETWKIGIALDKFPNKLLRENERLRQVAKKLIDATSSGKSANKDTLTIQKQVNTGSAALNKHIEERAQKYIHQNKLVAVLGGDHSTPLGLIKALTTKHSSFGILQVDAHADLRKSYEGFTYSHASIMYNVLQEKAVKKLIQVGVRDYCEEESTFIKTNKQRVRCFFDRELKQNEFEGKTWKSQVSAIIKELPKKVYISFDIDGLDPRYCPNTGTPVPGGLSFDQAIYLIESIVESNRTIIGFDINEVCPGKSEWDANVGARLLYKLAILSYASRKPKRKR